MENVVADTDIRKPEPCKGFQEAPGVLLRGGKIPVGHDTDRVSPAPGLAEGLLARIYDNYLYNETD